MEKHGSSYFFSLLFVLIVFCLAGFAGIGFAQEVVMDGEQAAPPPLDVQGPPDVVVVPSERYPNQYVYMVPGMEGVYVYQGRWYRNYGGYWYRASAYNGAWASVAVGIVPPVIVSVPIEYALFLPPYYHRIHYNEYYGHWREWDRGRYWHHQDWYRHEMRADVRRDRLNHIEAHREEVRHNRAEKNDRSGRDTKVRGGRDGIKGGDVKGGRDRIKGGDVKGGRDGIKGGDARGGRDGIKGGDVKGGRDRIKGGDVKGGSNVTKGGPAKKAPEKTGDNKDKRNH